jgi:hypothetical protein
MIWERHQIDSIFQINKVSIKAPSFLRRRDVYTLKVRAGASRERDGVFFNTLLEPAAD